ncbi:Ankycorbin [Podospora fimiseda]|uniref:Ankycorbin n=1 Tax=Podospora fimiseda TaxID=252190 RepID=A0AAN7BVY7_9PEZI|nr:Ankycorbin [Podospora fimiseda]
MATTTAPVIPAPLRDLPNYISQHPDTPPTQLFEPYRRYEAHVREAFAQDPENELLKDPHVNVLPLFTDGVADFKVRARDLANESKEEKSKYIMPLPKDVRRPNGSPAVVQGIKDFKRNFNVFSESSLVELDWTNVVAAGSSVTNCLLPVPQEYNATKRGLREFYHEKFAPASDVDLFLYGLTEEEAVEKIKQIESQVRDALLTETTTVRTKHAITICSQYPTRHIQIVLRIYKSVSEILTGFDIDCSGAAYDGKQVYCTPRALQSFMTQINHIDLSRRSPSYENRLSKFSHRGFEIYWPELDRNRIDPTIFERSFQRTLGLARLLVLERLPTASSRDSYRDQRRQERGRPPVNNYHRQFRSMGGNIKESHEDEVAEWMNVDEESNYHTFTIPYGPKFHAKRIEKHCYTKDLLLNAEWNQPKDREVYLHRHPAFFGRVDDVIQDCCGTCPVPKTDEEKTIAEEEAKIYVSGKISFLKDDPGRQSIGSFNPLTDDDWTDMAYVGNTARLCQAIVDGNAEHVADWLAQEGADPNTRDYTGRAPLHLAVMCSTPEIVQLLVNAGARLVARLADGRTALHLAAARGDVDIVKILMTKSIANEAEHEEKEEQRRLERKAAGEDEDHPMSEEGKDEDEDEDMDDAEDWEGSEEEGESMATGSFVKVRGKDSKLPEDLALEENEEEPDFYDINIIAWDRPYSSLHWAIIEGHIEVVKTLCQEYGADVLLPVKFLDFNKKPTGALLTLVLALVLPVPKAKEMASTLLALGATSAQADLNGVTAFHCYIEKNSETLLENLFENDPTGTKSAINHIIFPNSYSATKTALQLALEKGNLALVLKLLDKGAVPHIDFETWLKAAKQSANMMDSLNTFENNQKAFHRTTEQSLIVAINSSNPATALALLERGADPNVVTLQSQSRMQGYYYSSVSGESALDLVNNHLKTLQEYKGESKIEPPVLSIGLDTFLENFEQGTYQHWLVSGDIQSTKKKHHRALEEYERRKQELHEAHGLAEKAAAIKEASATMQKIKDALLAKGAKSFLDLYPEYKDPGAAHVSGSRSWGVLDVPDGMPTYKFKFSFQNVNDVTEARNLAYINLFEAAWKGDLDTIKRLTLTAWDDEKQEAPLKIAVKDSNQNNPFSLAFFCGHFAVATAVLEISQAQYVPDSKPKAQFKMDDSADYSDDDSAHGDDTGLNIYAELVDDEFTVENVGQVSMKVNSRTRPRELLEWSCPEVQSNIESGCRPSIWTPLSRAISKNDKKRLEFLLEAFQRFHSENFASAGETFTPFAFPETEFQTAINLGRTELLAEIIKSTGAGLPLEEMVKNTGVALVEKPRYYQGLTVYGKKRQDWATAGQESLATPSGVASSPLLLAALAGQIESVEWFMSDAPLRHYLTFCNSNIAARDPRVKHLSQSASGYEGAIKQWLNKDSDLIIHAAIYADPSKSADELVSYLVKTFPALLNVKDANGATPLLLACRLGRLNIAKVLIEAGADQRAKDLEWNNVLHAALHWLPVAEDLTLLLDTLDRQLLSQLLKERNNLGGQGQTPMHYWMSRIAGQVYYNPRHNDISQNSVAVFQVLTRVSHASSKQALQMLDSVGNTPLHTLLTGHAENCLDLIRSVLDFDPELLLVENAVGRTPVEVLHDSYIAEHIKENAFGGIRYGGWQSYGRVSNSSVSDLVARSPASFANKKTDDDEENSFSLVMKKFNLCKKGLAEIKDPKRKLVSLYSANLVAKRLGEGYMGGRYTFSLKKRKAGSDDDEDESSEVSSGSGGGEESGTTTTTRLYKKRKGDGLVSGRYNDSHSNKPWIIPVRTKSN